MNCDEYLSMLATASVDERSDGRAREHARTCRECDRVTRVVVERERTMLAAYEGMHTPLTATGITSEALRISRRRKVALYYRLGLGVTAAATIIYFATARGKSGASPIPTVSETIRLQCLSPEQAAEVLRPYLARTGRISMQSSSALGLIHVTASAGQLATAHKVLDKLDNPTASQCTVRVRVPKDP